MPDGSPTATYAAPDDPLAARAEGGSAVFDVAVVGAGLAGALLALILAREGRAVAVIDPNPAYGSDFRCEKLNPEQIAVLEALGVRAAFEAGLPRGCSLEASGFRYDEVVNAVRAAWPASVAFIAGQAADVIADAGDPAQRVVAADGELARARLIVIATGISPKLAARLGAQRRTISDQHSLCLGVTLRPAAGERFAEAGFVHRGEHAGDKVGFVSLFPLGRAMRANVFTYHDARDPWVRLAKASPIEAIVQAAPGLKSRLAGAEAVGPAELRLIDIYRTEPPARGGLVLIGDAYQTSCPSTAYGVTRLLSDIRVLVQGHLPSWLAAAEIDAAPIDAEKIAAYYADPAKLAADAAGLRKAHTARALAVETSPRWRALRLAAAAKRRLDALRRLRRPAAGPLQPGELVRVRSATEILASLDADHAVDGLPFMPEMAAFCGRELRIARRADKTCVEGHGLRGMQGAVLLERARCDGAAHDGCERACMIFWKEAWLARASEPAAAPDPKAEAAARAALSALSVRAGDNRYRCQSTELARASQALPRWSVGHLLADVRRGELSWPRLAEIVARTLVNIARRAVGLGDLDALIGPDGGAHADLGLKPGDRVRIRPRAAIAATLDHRGKNRGLSFEPEMATHAGRTYTVAAPVKRIIVETSGKMVTLKSTVALEGLDCQGRCARNCPRANPLYWREIWLERA